MLCDLCHKNEANIIFQVFQNGHMTSHPICAECAVKAQKNFLNVLQLLKNEERQPIEEKTEELPRRLCPHCGTAVDSIGDETVLGCPRCYEAAAEQIEALRAGVAFEGEKTEETKDDIPHRLREALASEDYEQAARLRDMIRDSGNGQED